MRPVNKTNFNPESFEHPLVFKKESGHFNLKLTVCFIIIVTLVDKVHLKIKEKKHDVISFKNLFVADKLNKSDN